MKMFYACFAATLLFLLSAHFEAKAQNCNTFVERKLTEAQAQNMSALSASDRLLACAKWMAGQPYVAGRLDRDSAEQLVIDVYALDCVTFVEYAMGLSLCVRENTAEYDPFAAHVKRIRYHNGEVSYANRLHYLSDWLQNAQDNGLVVPVLHAQNAKPVHKAVNLLSSLPSRPKPLRDPETCKAIRERELAISETTAYYLPTASVAGSMQLIQSGDIICFRTKKAGLDYEHVGIAIEVDGKIRLLHASQTAKKVVTTTEDLSGYLQQHPKFIGITIWRPL